MRQRFSARSLLAFPALRRCRIVLAAIPGAVLVPACGADDPDADAIRAVEAYVATVAARLSAVSGPERAVSTFVDPSTRVAVYLTPDGRVAISRGFLFTAAGEAELACAIAHEMAHKGSAGQLSQVAESAGAPGPRAWPEDVERAADESAAELCWQAGYDPRSLAVLLSRLSDMLDAEHPEEAESVERRAHALHAFLDGRNRTGELGYRKYQGIVGRLPAGAADTAAEDAVGYLIIGPIGAVRAWWKAIADLYDDGRYAAGEFASRECESWNLVPNNEVDAFGHCWFGCEGARRLGEGQTWFLGEGWELRRELGRELGSNEHDSHHQDVANQGRGRSMAGEDGSCLDLCTDAAHRGLLDFSAPEVFYLDCETGERVYGDVEVVADDSDAESSTAQSWGDPHLVTGDGYAYDFQAAGEFVAIRSLDDSLEVQVRQEFLPGRQTVSQNTAASARVHGDVVAFYVGDQGRVRLNGEDHAVSAAWSPLPGGGEIRAVDEGVRVRWQDGSALRVEAFTDFLNLYFEPAGSRAGRIGGLLGNFDGHSDNDLAIRGGAPVSLPDSGSGEYAALLYDRFGDSWRVSPEESMFEYPDGMSAADFQHAGRPAGVVGADSLDEQTRKEAAALCRAAGIRAQPRLDNCILDVGMSGEARFATAAADAASVGGQREVMATIAGAGTRVIDRFRAAAGQRYFFQTLELTGSLDLSRWELIAPGGEIVFGQCLRCNQPGEVGLPRSGIYVSRVVVSDQETGRIRTLSHPVPPEQVFDLELPARISADVPRTGAGRIELAGARDTYRFQAAAGERWRIILEASDGGLGFGEWSLEAPDGEQLFRSILPLAPSLPVDVELPQAGIYELRITGGASWPALTDAGYGNYRLSITVP